MFSKPTLPTTIVGLVLACGCGSATPSSTPPPVAEAPGPSMAEIRQRELDAERKEFIQAAHRRLLELESQIANLSVKIQYEPKFVDGAERTSWNQAVLARLQELSRLRNQLGRAQKATQQEWDSMRTTIASSIDSLEGSVERVDDELQTIFARADVPRAPTEVAMRIDTGLCPMEVKDAQAQTDVEERAGAVVLTLIVDKKETVPELRRKAQALAGKFAYTPAVPQQPAPQPEKSETALPIPAKISMQPIDGGVKITFKPYNATQLAALHEAVERDAGYIENRRCATGTPTET